MLHLCENGATGEKANQNVQWPQNNKIFSFINSLKRLSIFKKEA